MCFCLLLESQIFDLRFYKYANKRCTVLYFPLDYPPIDMIFNWLKIDLIMASQNGCFAKNVTLQMIIIHNLTMRKYWKQNRQIKSQSGMMLCFGAGFLLKYHSHTSIQTHTHIHIVQWLFCIGQKQKWKSFHCFCIWTQLCYILMCIL